MPIERIRRNHTVQVRFGDDELARLDGIVRARLAPDREGTRSEVVRELIDAEHARIGDATGENDECGAVQS